MDNSYEALVKSLREDKEKHFSKVYTRMFKPLTYFVLKFVNDTEMAKDIVADSLSIAYEKFDTYDDSMAELNTWIYTIAKNKCLNYVRTKADDISIESEIGNALYLKDILEDKADTIAEESLQTLCTKFVTVLDENDNTGVQSKILRYRYFDNLTNSEIAKKMNTLNLEVYNGLKEKCANSKHNKSLYMELLVQTESFARTQLITESQVKTNLKKSHCILKTHFKEIDLEDYINI